MRLGIRSIRARITALLLVPLISLAGLWAYTTVSSVDSVRGLLRVAAVQSWIGRPADRLAQDLQAERLAAVRYAAVPLSSGRAGADLSAFRAAEQATDRDAAVVSDRAGRQYNGISAEAYARLRDVADAVGGLGVLRDDVLQHRLEWDDIYAQYTNLQDPFFQLRSALSGLQTGELARQAADLIELVRAREYLSREDALLTGAQTSGAMALNTYQAFLATVDGERLLFNVYLDALPDDVQNLYTPFTGGSTRAALTGMEASVSVAGLADAPRAVDALTWRQTMDAALGQLAGIQQQADALATGEAQDTAYGVFRHDAVVGGIGLAALLIALWVSVRIGRGLARELIALRNAALELAGSRLPAVIRRLRDGERVDVAAEAPPLQQATPPGRGKRRRAGERDEIAQVGRAFDAVRRAAVEAAVEEAELRRGISAVFVNLARRSQALLNRQLNLLDEMERRATDPTDLEGLFQLDHLTTRMRRHADGLLILSGAAPGRIGRRPVRVLDVVRAAVGEVEDYPRVTVHPMPPVAVVGAAVSDVVHLLAELVENATAYSPPQTRVRVQGGLVAQGFALEIDDRGLGMGEEVLQEANDRLAGGGEFQLADSDRMGLFVVSRLAHRHGVRVTLRRSPYGGTTAVVLLPADLLVRLAPERADPAPEPVPAERVALHPAPAAGGSAPDGGRPPLPGRRPRPVRGLPSPARAAAPDRRGEGQESVRSDAAGRPALRPVGPQPARVEPAPEGAPGRLPRRVPGRAAGSTADAPAGPAPAALGAGSATARTAPAPPDARPALAARPEEPGGAPLPRRVRQASLAPQLRDGGPSGRDAERTNAPARERTPEEARAVFGSFQRGLARARGDAGPGTGSTR